MDFITEFCSTSKLSSGIKCVQSRRKSSLGAIGDTEKIQKLTKAVISILGQCNRRKKGGKGVALLVYRIIIPGWYSVFWYNDGKSLLGSMTS